MQLERIRLKSFGCFQEQDFDLTDGINLIFGPNFSGKSTLVNAIFFTLTGKPIVPRVAAGAIKSPKSRTGTAGLQFVIDGERYMLYRGTGKRFQLRRKREGKWYIDVDENRVTIVEAILKERFGLIHDRIALTTFLREGEIFEFLARQPSTRRDILYALLGIDELMGVRERFIDARRLAKRERNRIQSHQNSLRISEQNSHKNEIERIETNLKKLEATYGEETGETELIAELIQNRKQAKIQLDALKQEQAETLSGFNDTSHLGEMMQSIETALNEATTLESEREELIQKIGSVESQISAITKVCNTLKELIESNEGHCPTCHQRVEREVVEKIIREKETERKNLSTGLTADKDQLSEKSSSLENRQALEQRINTLKTKATRIEQIEKDITKIESDISTFTDRLNQKGVTEEIEIIDESDNTDSKTDESTIEKTDRYQLKTRIESERKKLERLKQQEAVHSDRLQQLKTVNLEAEKVDKTTLCIELACDGVEKSVETLQRQILKPAELELHRWLEEMELFGKTQIDLEREHLLPSINIDGTDRSLLLLSGSEKMFLYLCFKVALAKVLGNTGFFVFDDPTLHLDDERKALMVTFIRRIAEEYQVIVTSYDEDVRAGLEGANLIEMKRESGDIVEETI